MKQKLAQFEQFAQQIFPHEISYLLRENNINDPERLNILYHIAKLANGRDAVVSFDTSIDKRKYSHLKKWIHDKLEKIDVDVFYDWINEIDQKVMLDTITPEEERSLLKIVREYEHCHFYFIKLYEILQNYSHFLLVRLRLKDLQLVQGFLNQYEYAYKYNKLNDENLNKASREIIQNYAQGDKSPISWRSWLSSVLYDEQTQGHMRYMALIRLHFCALCDGDYSGLREHYEYMDGIFDNGQFYSKRILVNYYFNRMLLHTKYEEYRDANRYGYLSIKVKTHDYLLYCNNLSSVLLRQRRPKEALIILRGANSEYKNSNNFYHKTEYVALFMQGLLQQGETKSAIDYGLSFYKAYKKEIFDSRWHIYFSTLLKSLHKGRRYEQIIKIVRQNKLLIKEEALSNNAQSHSQIEHFYNLAMEEL